MTSRLQLGPDQPLLHRKHVASPGRHSPWRHKHSATCLGEVFFTGAVGVYVILADTSLRLTRLACVGDLSFWISCFWKTKRGSITSDLRVNGLPSALTELLKAKASDRSNLSLSLTSVSMLKTSVTVKRSVPRLLNESLVGFLTYWSTLVCMSITWRPKSLVKSAMIGSVRLVEVARKGASEKVTAIVSSFF